MASLDWLRRAVVSAMVPAALLVSVPSIGGEASDDPVDVSKLDRGSCPSGQVSSDRGCITLPKLTKRVIPQYPQRARDHHFQCKVNLSIIIEPDGMVSSPTVVKSTRPGFGFEEASIHAVSQWQYKPALLEDKALRVRYEVVTEFSLP